MRALEQVIYVKLSGLIWCNPRLTLAHGRQITVSSQNAFIIIQFIFCCQHSLLSWVLVGLPLHLLGSKYGLFWLYAGLLRYCVDTCLYFVSPLRASRLSSHLNLVIDLPRLHLTRFMAPRFWYGDDFQLIIHINPRKGTSHAIGLFFSRAFIWLNYYLTKYCVALGFTKYRWSRRRAHSLHYAWFVRPNTLARVNIHQSFQAQFL